MEMTRIYTEVNGESHFDVDPIIMEETSDMGFFSAVYSNVKHFYFQKILPNHEWDFRSVDNKVYIVIIDGALEIEVSDGEKRTFNPTDIIYLDDHTGKGHKVDTHNGTVSALVIHLK